MSKGRLFVVSAPSGCGKGTVLGEVFKEKKVFYSVSCTTRKPRPGEKNGEQYYFLTDEEFEKMVAENKFLEHAGFVGHYYGTPAGPVKKALDEGIDAVLEIETQGAFQVKKSMPEAVLVFILPPSVKELENRLKKRGTESEEVISQRVAQASGEIKKAYDYDYVIMNDNLEQAVEDFESIMNCAKGIDSTGEKFRTDNEDIKKLIGEVL